MAFPIDPSSSTPNLAPTNSSLSPAPTVQVISPTSRTPASRHNIDSVDSIVIPVSNTTASKCFRFNEQLDILLLHAALTAGVHITTWRKTQDLFEKSHDMFVNAEQFKSMQCTVLPCWKTLSDWFKKLVTDRRTANKCNGASSGISEVHGKREQLLDDIIIQIDEKQEAERTEKEEKTAQEKRLQDAGEQMRNSAVKRLRRNKSRASPGNTSSGDSDVETKLIAKELETRKIAQ